MAHIGTVELSCRRIRSRTLNFEVDEWTTKENVKEEVLKFSQKFHGKLGPRDGSSPTDYYYYFFYRLLSREASPRSFLCRFSIFIKNVWSYCSAIPLCKEEHRRTMNLSE